LAVPAHMKILGIHSFCPDIRYMAIHFALEMMGKLTSRKTGEI